MHLNLKGLKEKSKIKLITYMSSNSENIKRCYVCNKILVDVVSNSELECKKHGEHIIQNAIAGHYVSDRILCERCGNDYSKDDSNFSDIFASFLVLLNNGNKLHVLDRGKIEGKAIYGALGTSSDPDSPDDKKIVFKSGNISPVKPYYYIDEENHSITLYAEKNTAKNYWGKIAKELAEQGLRLEDYQKVNVNNLGVDGILKLYFSKDNPEFNDSFKRGFVKIAVEFALDRGIKREDIDILIIDEKTQKAEIDFDNTLMFPYVPVGEIDKIYESERVNVERNFPSHSMRLFSVNYTDNTSKLFCYVDLFSTFQFYILLNKNYKGKDINEWYAHKLLKNSRTYSDEDIDLIWRPKELYCAICDIIKDEEERKEVQSLNADEIKFRLKDILRKKPLEYDLKESAKCEYLSIVERIGAYLINKMSSVQLCPCNLNDYSKSVIESAMGANTLSLFLIEELEKQIYDGYKQCCYSILVDENEQSSPDASLKLYIEQPDVVKIYSYMKFIVFSNYCYKEAGFQ